MTSWLAQDSAGHRAERDLPEAARYHLVLGFGNVLLSDDGAGIQVVERLRAELGEDAADFIDAGTLELQLAALHRGDGFDAGDRCRRYQRSARRHWPVRRRGNGRISVECAPPHPFMKWG